MTNISRRNVLAGLCLTLMMTPALAAALAMPTGDVILTIDGTIGVTNAGSGADFDLAMLEALPKTSFTTATPWTEDKTVFEGVLLKDLLATVGAKGASISAMALNDYAAPLPASDAETAGVLVAYKVNGEYISVREKGPLWVIYPFDDKPELKTEEIYSRSVWQLRRLTISE